METGKDEANRKCIEGIIMVLDALKETLCGQNADNVQIDMDSGVGFVNIEDRKTGIIREVPYVENHRRCIISWTEKNMP